MKKCLALMAGSNDLHREATVGAAKQRRRNGRCHSRCPVWRVLGDIPPAEGCILSYGNAIHSTARQPHHLCHLHCTVLALDELVVSVEFPTDA
jgi:hypothetical protein